MTLLIASARHDAQFIVGDRRITDLQTGKVIDDSTYKIFLYVNLRQRYRFGVAFTGLAHLGNASTIDWLMRILPKAMDSQSEISRAIPAFISECTNRFQAITTLQRQHKGLTVIFCGSYNKFGSNRSVTENIPFTTIISNCVDRNFKQINSVSSDFTGRSHRLFKPEARYTTCRGDLQSATPYLKEFKRMSRLFRKQKQLSHQTRIKIAADYIRAVASHSDTVGMDILGLAILKDGNSEGFDYHVDESNLVQTMPHCVSAGGQILTNFKVTPARS